MPSYEYRVFAGFSQFFLLVDGVQPLLSEKAVAGDCRSRIKVAPHMVVVSSVRSVMVPLKIDVLNEEPSLDLSAWDHIVECSLEVPSGRIVVAGCTDYLPDCERFELAPSSYRIRVLYGALSSLDDEHYRIVLWPASAGELQVIKQYEEAASASSEDPVAQALLDESLYETDSKDPISPQRQAWADQLGGIVAFCAAVFLLSIWAGSEAFDMDAPAAGVPILVGSIVTIPPAILCTVIACLLVGADRAKLAWKSLCLFLIPVIYAVGMEVWEAVAKKF